MEKNMEDTTERSDVKRKSRNQGEKRRRDQFNLIVDELNSMVSSTNQKLDKSTVLKATIAFLKQRNEANVHSQNHEIQENWKPLFLSNEEFTQLMLEALDGFIMAFSSHGQILHASESITPLLGHLSGDLLNTSIYDLVYEKDHLDIYNILTNPTTIIDPMKDELTCDNQVYFTCHLKKRGLNSTDETAYELIQFMGYFRKDIRTGHHYEIDESLPSTSNSRYLADNKPKLLFVGMGRIKTPQLARETFIIDPTKIEFTSRHSLEWKFLFLDQRATSIIGYLPFEVLGTSGYDYYHFDDLDKLIKCHESIMRKGEGTSCYYRFLTKGQRWIWLQTRFYISYHQWNSKPEFIICTHRPISYADVLEQMNASNTAIGEDRARSNGVKNDEQQLDERRNDFKSEQSKHRERRKASSSKSRRDDKPIDDKTVVIKRSSSLILRKDGNNDDACSPLTQPNAVSRRPHKLLKRSYAKTTISTQNRVHLDAALEYDEPPEKLPYTVTQSIHLKPEATGSACVNSMNRLDGAAAVQPPTISPQMQTNIISSMQSLVIAHRDIVITPNQSNVQIQLQRQHEKLQQDIMKQQKELERVAEQLRLARYGIVPALPNANVPVDIRSHITYKSVDYGPVVSDDVNQLSAGDTLANSDGEQQSYKLCDQSLGNAHETVSQSLSPRQHSLHLHSNETDGGMQARPNVNVVEPLVCMNDEAQTNQTQMGTDDPQH